MKAKIFLLSLVLIFYSDMFFGQGITIQPGAMVTVQDGGKLSTTSTAGITVKSDVSGTGSYLDQNASSGNVDFSGTQTVERYISGDTKYHIFSSAVLTATFGNIFLSNQGNIWVREYVESTNTYVNHIFNESASQGIGYTIYLSGVSSTTATFTGTLGTGSIAKGSSLTGIDITGPGNGWNLVGNPYPSAISWNALTKTNLLASVYAWNAAGGNWDSYNGSAGALTNGIIPSGQGFFVQVTGASPTLTFENACRVHGTSSLYYKASRQQDVLSLGVTTGANAYSDKVFICFDSHATSGFDRQYDAYKLRGEAEAPELYTIADQILSIDVRNSIQDSPIIPLGFKSGVSAEYTFTAEGIESFSPSTPIFLDDLVTGVKTDLRQAHSYTFQAEKGEFTDRFRLGFSTVGIQETELSSLTLYAKDKTVYLKLPVLLDGTVSVHNILGQPVYNNRIQSDGIMRIPIEGSTGIYMISVVTGHAQRTMKIFIE